MLSKVYISCLRGKKRIHNLLSPRVSRDLATSYGRRFSTLHKSMSFELNIKSYVSIPIPSPKLEWILLSSCVYCTLYTVQHQLIFWTFFSNHLNSRICWCCIFVVVFHYFSCLCVCVWVCLLSLLSLPFRIGWNRGSLHMQFHGCFTYSTWMVSQDDNGQARTIFVLLYIYSAYTTVCWY